MKKSVVQSVISMQFSQFERYLNAELIKVAYETASKYVALMNTFKQLSVRPPVHA